MNHSLTATAVFALLGLTGSPAAQKKAVAKALTPESSLSARSISDLQLSPIARYGFGGCRYWLVQTPPLGMAAGSGHHRYSGFGRPGQCPQG